MVSVLYLRWHMVVKWCLCDIFVLQMELVWYRLDLGLGF